MKSLVTSLIIIATFTCIFLFWVISPSKYLSGNTGLGPTPSDEEIRKIKADFFITLVNPQKHTGIEEIGISWAVEEIKLRFLLFIVTLTLAIAFLHIAKKKAPSTKASLRMPSIL